MFPLQPSDEMVFGTPTTPQGDQIHDDLIADSAAFKENNLINFSTGSKDDRRLGRTTNFESSRQRETDSRSKCNIRKATRRDIERKRRQEMSNLNISLCSLLPFEHSKGKRSVCDQMQEAVNYIKHMQKNVRELRFRRDKLKELSISFESSNGNNSSLPNCVTVNQVQDGLEILISINSDFGLSRVLEELVEKELDVVSCVSTRTEGGFLHKIRIEGRDITKLDVSVLRNGLTNTIASNMG